MTLALPQIMKKIFYVNWDQMLKYIREKHKIMTVSPSTTFSLIICWAGIKPLPGGVLVLEKAMND